MTITTIVILLMIGLLAGVLSGFVGVGGGILIVPALVFCLGFSQHMAQGTSLALMMPPIGILGFYNYYRSGNTDITAAAVIAVAFIIGAYFGSRLSITLDDRIIKRIFAAIMIAAAIKLLVSK